MSTEILYGGAYDESFSAKTPEEYLLEVTDFGTLDRSSKPIEVVGYRRLEVSERWITSAAERLFESFVESFDDEFGGDDTCFALKDSEEAPAVARVRDALAIAIKEHATVWACEEVSRRTWSPDEIVSVLVAAVLAEGRP
jgi:hypothetical protein